MAEEIIVGVSVVIIVAGLGWIAGVFRVPRNVADLELSLDRSKRDYALWRERHDAEVAYELRGIDEEHNARGTYDSGIRLDDRQKVLDRAARETKEQLIVMFRAWEDAFRKLRRVDRVWLVWAMKPRGETGRVKGTWKALFGKLASVERDILQPALERAENELGPDSS